MKTILTIPGKVPQNNGKDGLLRMHWSKRCDLRDKWFWLFRSQTRNRHPGKVKVHITHYYTGGAIKDYGNLVSTEKIPMDAVVLAGIIKDDSMAIIGSPTFSQVKVKHAHQVQTVIEITDVEEEILL